MKSQSLLLLGLLLVWASLAEASYPPDVAEYIERREVCEHFRQEPWPEGSSVEDKERREFIAGQFERYCKGTDRTIRDLKKKYINNQAVIEKLEKYEDDIEAQS